MHNNNPEIRKKASEEVVNLFKSILENGNTKMISNQHLLYINLLYQYSYVGNGSYTNRLDMIESISSRILEIEDYKKIETISMK